MTIKLSKKQLNKDAIGYQKPKPSDFKYANARPQFQQRRDNFRKPYGENRRPFGDNKDYKRDYNRDTRRKVIPFGNARSRSNGRFPHELRSKEEGFTHRD